MPLPETFAEVTQDPEFQSLPFPEQQKVRKTWAEKRARASGNYRKNLQIFQAEAYQGAPEWGRPEAMAPPFPARYPRLYAAGATALGVPWRLLQTLPRLGTELTTEMGAEPPRGPVEAFTRPFRRTGEFMAGRREELPPSPERAFVETLADPLMYTGLGLAARARQLGRMAPGAIKAIPKVTRVLPPTLPAELAEVGVGGAWSILSPQQRQIYTQAMQLGKAHFPLDELRRLAETIAKLSPSEAEKMLFRLKSGKGISQLRKWAEQPVWGRAPLKEAPKAPTKAPRGKVPIEEPTAMESLQVTNAEEYARWLAGE